MVTYYLWTLNINVASQVTITSNLKEDKIKFKLYTYIFEKELSYRDYTVHRILPAVSTYIGTQTCSSSRMDQRVHLKAVYQNSVKYNYSY